MNEMERTRRIKDLAEKLAYLADDVAGAAGGEGQTALGPHITLFLVHFDLENTIVPELKEICKTFLVK